MKKYILIVLIFNILSLNAQNAYQSVLDQIEANSTVLSAYRSHAEAEKAENYAGSLFANPELEAGYLFGINDGSEHRIDLSINQEFDFPTVYSNKNKIRKLNNEVIDLEYEIQRNEFFYQAQQICTDLIFNNICLKYHEQCLENAETMEKALQRKLEVGEATVLEYRNAKMNYIGVRNEYEMHIVERERLIGELKTLNGGVDIDFTQDFYDEFSLPEDFDSWYQDVENNNPIFVQLNLQNVINQRNIKLTKSEWAPKLNVGYMMEKESDGGYHGPTIGISLPFWGNARTVRAAEAKAASGEAILENQKATLHNELQNQFLRAKILQSNYLEMNELIQNTDSRDLLREAYEKGEKTLVEYLVEFEYQHDAVLEVFQLQHEYQKVLVDLQRYMIK
ncbi:MAG: TolC family protein [Bacteroidia bacterium]|nr:TolC family protein [Bacteroidia bacterium]